MFPGETPLYRSIKNGHVGTANWLLNNGADPRIKSLLGITTLHQAAIRGKIMPCACPFYNIPNLIFMICSLLQEI